MITFNKENLNNKTPDACIVYDTHHSNNYKIINYTPTYVALRIRKSIRTNTGNPWELLVMKKDGMFKRMLDGKTKADLITFVNTNFKTTEVL